MGRHNENIGHQARKRFGQNFLHDQGVIDRIVRSINPKSDQNLVEIGPGLGALTEELLKSGGSVTAVELDRDLTPILRTKFFNYPQFNVIEADALKFDFTQLATPERPMRLIGNLPYNISTPLIFHLLTFRGLVQDMYFMLQKEVVDRLAAKPGEDAYGRLGVMAQYYCKVESLFNVGPGAFQPAPKVWSAIVRLTPYTEPPLACKDVATLTTVVRQAFAMRRKTLRNTLKQLITVDALQSLDIDPQIRPERLGLPEFVRIADYVYDHPLENES
ncbi:dimethyladenosine transferase [Hahella chejuensis KCTC 2396]|uniref:Ribosomal RNA small subunit methyltransferase A n=1 Tax=Hahella chejuensis (strain KCTC 2396) TaxID=349521 RepID=RSMA_HAHCH|nr:16S rRNA (adenine(1518)-N(6)/adenine(1519)-N(6))-dimethyltransferase RsmA [Hahella chejuensis]Q2S9C3.1 RecName: Full=Ribosomal RNA small subunit methyltransferase A; AltName: Full=16S rRNA (adenine(1518)-N(6)/adenine(1519)-N(6))-dimethyltransferase; AltName: Full=16S rRNA dimethyladenosine transferase; AltName: Full=16S rRNA dimethylase; AltName: Full=S-adenosylmethionine-6-N', N'-adenosyl(rRNA) dimethyltransferase [Hahella chejuensis KCTC 2396]ABC32751.1 dimethyladenosine transferase [Hahella